MNTDRDNLRQAIRDNTIKILLSITGIAKKKVNGQESYICPLCGHGKGGDGMTFNPHSASGYTLKCFGCNWTGDIIDLVQTTQGITHNEALSLLANQIGKEYPTLAETALKRPVLHCNENSGEEQAQSATAQERQPQPDLSAYFIRCMENLTEHPEAEEYVNGRGISTLTALECGIGFDPAWKSSKAGERVQPTPCIIIPTGGGTYTARAIADDAAVRYMNEGSPALFNEQMFDAQEVQAVFVCEGAFDAMAIMEAGGSAVAINSASNTAALINKLERVKTSPTIILCLDNDSAGRAATDRIKQELERLNYSYTIANMGGDQKDPNAFLMTDKAAFVRAVKREQSKATKPDSVSLYMQLGMDEDIARFTDVKKTGFDNLDRKAGGLYPGLYTVAAISSLGKTTFCHQIADQLAASGTDVLFFSLEQSRLELVTKSIARRTAQADIDTAVTSLNLRRGEIPLYARQAAAKYAEDVGDRLSIIEGNFGCDISFIGDYIRGYVSRNNTRPVVFIDYLQILQPDHGRERQQTARETIDNSVTELKRLSRELDLTIFVICSINRANYLTPVDFESLKESGGIEYTCDVIWGLQLQCLNDPAFDKAQGSNIKERRDIIKRAKAESPRKIELVCLKNRYGIANFSCSFYYTPAYDLFEPIQEAGEKSAPRRRF